MAFQLNLNRPAVYHIKVQGTLSSEWAEYLGGLEINVSRRQESLLTTLTGEIIDQAALIGILNSLYNLGFPILAVEYEPSRRER